MRPASRIGVIGSLSGFLAVAEISACAGHAAPPAPAPSSLAIRIVDSSRSAEPVLAAKLWLIGPLPRTDTVTCSDSTRQPVLWVGSLQPGRYQLMLRRSGFQRRLILIDVPQHQADTVTVGLRALTRDLQSAAARLPPDPPCATAARSSAR
jgi:hypothetical protein